MAKSKGNIINAETNPFELLLEEIESDIVPIVLSDKEKKHHELRTGERLGLTGSAVLYDLHEKLITKAVLRNLSPGGVGFEIFPVPLDNSKDIYVQFVESGIDLGLVRCHIQWIAPIEGHHLKHKMVGLQFAHLPALAKKKLDQFLALLKDRSGYDPFAR
jgi:hypothetical protein